MTDKKFNVDNKTDCTACGLCINICPVKSIEMKQNEEGFYVPFVNNDKCINCGRCIRECIVTDGKNAQIHEKKFYAATSKCSERRNSSSGGIFYALANQIINNGGVVYGCAIGEDMTAMHIRAENHEELKKTLKSKYVQSYIMNVYKTLEDDLKNNRQVLFSGTPCQVAAIKKQFSGYSNLFLVDIVCHGVSSPSFFKEHISYLEKKYNSRVTAYSFRNKIKKLGYIEKITLQNNKVITRKAFKSFYFSSFLNMNAYNNYCYKCRFASMDRPGDITLGDYHWGIKKHSNMKDKMDSPYDLSMVMTNSEKGDNMLRKLEKDIYLEKTDLDLILERNKNLQKPSERPVKSENFYKELKEKGYRQCEKEYRHTKKYLRNIFPLNIIVKLKNKFI